MNKKLADEIGKSFVRLHCSHDIWLNESSLKMGSFSHGVIVCSKCGKRKFVEQLKSNEVLKDACRFDD